jgi:MoxR-like ATPase
LQHPAHTPQTPEAKQLESALFEVKRVIVGQDRAIERLFVCLLSGGHCLLEGVPGLAKTLAMETLARVSGGSFTRIQFTPDLLPADIVGTRIYRASSEQFDVELGPIFANFVLADEVNRAPAKVQSALLEVMAEHHVSIGGRTFGVPEPFLVLATQNPVEQEGVYPLPEAQRDRFLMKVVVGYPSGAEEVEIVNRMGVSPPVPRRMLAPDDVLALQQAASAVYVDRGVVDYAVSLVLATRQPQDFGLPELEEFIEYGASPRASLGLVAAARALSLMRGRRYALPQDVFDVAPEILRHRLVLSYEAIAQGLHVDQISARILSTVPAPRVAPSQDQHFAAGYQPDAYQPTGSHPAAAQPAPVPPGEGYTPYQPTYEPTYRPAPAGPQGPQPVPQWSEPPAPVEPRARPDWSAEPAPPSEPAPTPRPSQARVSLLPDPPARPDAGTHPAGDFVPNPAPLPRPSDDPANDPWRTAPTTQPGVPAEGSTPPWPLTPPPRPAGAPDASGVAAPVEPIAPGPPPPPRPDGPRADDDHPATGT